MREIIFDTETTGLSPRAGHRIVEIGCVELIDRKPTGSKFHGYINPERESDPEALAVHGLDTAFLATQPRFFEIVDRFIDYVRGATLIAHNARFDVGFLNAELLRCKPSRGPLQDHVGGVIDTLELARKVFPGKTLSLNQLCARLGIDTSHRDRHGALLDAQLLARAYLALTARQDCFAFEINQVIRVGAQSEAQYRRLQTVRIVRATEHEIDLHEQMLARIRQQSGRCLWLDGELGPIRCVNEDGNSDTESPE